MARRAFGRGLMVAVMVFPAAVASPAGAQEPAPKPAAPDLLTKAKEFIKPLPLEPIPDNPPPHEGAMFAISHRIESVDLVLVEVLQALPGRPITGERLVRPDGTISLGFYGDVHLAGLTQAQAKTKVILHLRPFLQDRALGLITYLEPGRKFRDPDPPLDPFPELPPPERFDVDLGAERPRILVPAEPMKDGAEKAEPKKENAEGNPPPAAQPTQAPLAKNRSVKIGDFFPGMKIQEFRMPADELLQNPDRGEVAGRGVVPEPGPALQGSGSYAYVNPMDSMSVFVDIAAYNTKAYYVIGLVGSPGRLTYTGHETVLDALQYAGGLLPGADRRSIRINRPARGDKPARTYRIDLDAIERGESKANLQLFPGDRLIIGRDGEPKLHLN